MVLVFWGCLQVSPVVTKVAIPGDHHMTIKASFTFQHSEFIRFQSNYSEPSINQTSILWLPRKSDTLRPPDTSVNWIKILVMWHLSGQHLDGFYLMDKDLVYSQEFSTRLDHFISEHIVTHEYSLGQSKGIMSIHSLKTHKELSITMLIQQHMCAPDTHNLFTRTSLTDSYDVSCAFLYSALLTIQEQLSSQTH